MKTNIHPTYHSATVKCACGHTFTTGSTKPQIYVEICSKCHPFFTGERRFVDTLGRVDKFKKAQAAAANYVAKNKKNTKPAEVKTLKEMLQEAVKAKA